jgi:four helix bundle protein
MKESDSRARRTGPALEAMYQFVLWLIPAVEKFPRSQKFLLGDRIQATALDCLERLIEATYTKSRESALNHANLALEKLRFMFRLAYDLKFVDLKRFEHAARNLDEVGRMIGGWLRTHRAAQG